MGSVDLHFNFFKEFFDFKVVFDDTVLDECRSQGGQIIKMKGVDCILGESVAHKWVQAVLGFVEVINDHNAVSEVSIVNDGLVEVSLGEGHSKLTADIESNITLCILILLALHVIFDDCLEGLGWNLAGVWSG